MNIRSIAANNPETADFLNVLLSNSELLNNYMEFFTGAGDSTRKRKTQGDFAGQTRELDSAYTTKTAEPEYMTSGRKIFGDAIQIDIARQRMGFDIGSELANQVRRSAPGLAHQLHNLFINGDPATSSSDILGLKALSDATSGQTIVADTNGLEVLRGSDNTAVKSQQAFLELIYELIATCKGNNKILVMGSKASPRFNTIARDFISWTETSFGNKIKSFNGTPILEIEKNKGGIILPNETQGTMSGTQRIYCVSLEEADGISYFSTPEGLMVYEATRDKNFIESTIDLIADTAVFNDKAVASIKGLKF